MVHIETSIVIHAPPEQDIPWKGEVGNRSVERARPAILITLVNRPVAADDFSIGARTSGGKVHEIQFRGVEQQLSAAVRAFTLFI